MDNNFVFPRPAPAVPRPTPPVTTTTSPSSPTNPRESNALRASVLDAALQLGIGNNSTVTNWMFSNSLAEEDEEPLRSPSLTHESTATSEESSPGHFPWTPPAQHHVQPTFPLIPPNPFAASASEAHIHFDKDVGERPARPAMGAGIPFPEPPRPTTPSRGKLRKKRADGYESDGGYISDAGKKKGKESGSDKKAKAKEAKERAKEEKLQEKKEKEEERKRKKSMGKNKKEEDKDGYATGYETDGTSKLSRKAKGNPTAEGGYETDGASKKKSKGKSGDGGYETDSGYVSSNSTKGKSKKGFFGLKSKQSKADLRQEEEVPPMPSIDKDPLSLPIASKFATSIDTGPLLTGESLNSMISKAMDAPTAAALAATPTPAPISQYSYQPTSSPHFSPNNRESLSSAESGGSMSPTTGSSLSHSSKRRGFQFLGHDLGRGGGGSSSTITPPAQVPLPPSAVSTPVSERQSFPSMPLSTSNAHASSRGHAPSAGSSSPVQHSASQSLNSHPSPLSPIQPSSSNSLNSPPSAFTQVHTASANSPPSAFPPVQHSSPTSFNSPPSAFTPQVFPTARNPSLSRGTSITKSQLMQVAPPQTAPAPEPIVHTAPVVTPPVQSTRTPSTPPARTSPAITQPLRLSPPATQYARLSPTTAAAQPRLPPTGSTQPLRTRPRPTLTPSPVPPSPASYLRSPSPAPSERPSLTIIPSSDYIVPSPRASPLPSPNVLAYYDIPPPSLPPSGPLPKVPPPGSFASPNRARPQERSRNGSQGNIARSRTPEPSGLNQTSASAAIQRGRESPFPARPVLPQSATPSVGPGLEAAVKVPRYQELYGLPLPKETHNEMVQRREVDRARDWEKERRDEEASTRRPASDGSWADHGRIAYDDDEEEEEEDDMRHVLERFDDSRVSMHMDALQKELDGSKAGRSMSFEAIRRRINGRYQGNRDSDYHDDVDEDEGARKSSMEYDDETNSRWSGSIYSRASVLDPEKSEEARQRFLKRVEDLYGDEKETVPPVPKIPDAFVDGSGRNWNRF